MRRILRYEIDVNDEPQRHLIHGEVRKVAATYREDGGRLRPVVEFWAEDIQPTPDGELLQRTFQVVGTGHPLPEGAVWRGTTDRTREGFVWHLYELTGEGEKA